MHVDRAISRVEMLLFHVVSTNLVASSFYIVASATTIATCM